MNERVAIVDLDGTVYRGGTLIDGAADGLARLREAGYTIRYVSNSPTSKPADYAMRLQALGLDVDPSQVRSAGSVTTASLADRHLDDDIFLIGSDGLRSQFHEAGLAVTEDPETAGVLVASWDPTFGYKDMMDALHLDDPAFYGTDPDTTFPNETGDIAPGSGAIIAAVESVLGREPDQIFGKPDRAMLEAALEGTDATGEDCLVVGDRVSTDIALGERIGATTVLVQTGVDSERELADCDIHPDHVINDLSAIEGVLSPKV
ncbi:MAG: HAD-IIA family hydrolase [Halapricum sp.]